MGYPQKRTLARTISIEGGEIRGLYSKQFKGGGKLFRVIISFGLGPPEVAPYMTGTFGEVFGPRNQTDSEPRAPRP